MIFKDTEYSGLKKRYALPAAASLTLIFNACAPTQPAPEPEVEATQVPQTIESPQTSAATATPQSLPAPNVSRRPAFDPHNPDWELRYQELYEKFSTKFSAPPLGKSVQIELQNGTKKSGILKSLSPTELSLELGNGEMTLAMGSLSAQSASRFFASAYGQEKALEQGRREYQRWERMQASSQPAPQPTQPVQGNATPTGGNSASTPGQNGVDVPDNNPTVGSAPKNEGPEGRVKQVDQYIRKNAALPNSLQVKAWGPVQKNGNGYKVRVQYSLESAGGFGRSHEDMMFFMYASGRVYRKAAVK